MSLVTVFAPKLTGPPDDEIAVNIAVHENCMAKHLFKDTMNPQDSVFSAMTTVMSTISHRIASVCGAHRYAISVIDRRHS